MSDTPPIPPPQTPASLGEARIMAIACYVLFIATFTNGLTGLVGVVLAYIKRADARGTIWESHFNNLIHVFWSGVVLFAVLLAALAFGAKDIMHAVQTDDFPGIVLLAPLLWLCGVGYLVWYLYRMVKGLIRAIDNKAYS